MSSAYLHLFFIFSPEAEVVSRLYSTVRMHVAQKSSAGERAAGVSGAAKSDSVCCTVRMQVKKESISGFLSSSCI